MEVTGNLGYGRTHASALKIGSVKLRGIRVLHVCFVRSDRSPLVLRSNSSNHLSIQLVRIRPTQNVANMVEPNLTHKEVTNYVKLRDEMYWVVTQVKDISSEILNIVLLYWIHRP